MPVVDAHNHAGWRGMSFEEHLQNMDRFGIEKTWLLSWECPAEEYSAQEKAFMPLSSDGMGPISLAEGVSYKNRAPERFVIGYAPDPRSPGAVQKLERAVLEQGVRVCGEVKLRLNYDEPCMLEIFHLCAQYALPVVLHIDTDTKWWYGGGLDVLEHVLRQCPDTVFLGHAPGFWERFGPNAGGAQNAETLLRKYKNLYCDISANSGYRALNRDVRYTRAFLETFADRVLYGRDMFENIHREFLDSLGLEQDIMAMICGMNAERLTAECERRVER